MPRGSYQVQEQQDGFSVDVDNGVGYVNKSKQLQRDKSFRSCVHAMGIFLAICIIVILAFYPYKYVTSARGKDLYEADKHAGGPGVHDSSSILSTSATEAAITITHASDSIEHHDPSTIDIEKVRETTTDIHVPTVMHYRKTSRTQDVITATTEQIVPETNITTMIPYYDNSSVYTNADVSNTNKFEKYMYFGNQKLSKNSTVMESVISETSPSTESSVADTSPSTESSVADTSPSTESSVADTSPSTESSVADTSPSTESCRVKHIHDTETTSDLTPATKLTTSIMGEVDNFDFEHTSMKAKKFEQLREWTDTTISSWQTSSESDSTTCTSPKCMVLASHMISLMNHNASPCTDFYEYSCGGLRTNKALIEIDPQQDVQTRIREKMSLVKDSTKNLAYLKFKNYYDKCMSFEEDDNPVDRKTNVLIALQELGPPIDVSIINSTVDFTDLISNLILSHSTPLFDVLLDVDSKNPTRFSLKITLPVFESIFKRDLSQRDCPSADMGVTDMNAYYDAYKKCTISAYLDEVENTVKTLYENTGNLASSIRFNIEEMILYIDTNGTQEEPSANDKRTTLVTKNYEDVPIRTLAETIGTFIDWKRLFAKLLNLNVDKLDENTRVQVYFKNILRKKLSLLSNEDEQLKIYRALLAIYAHELYYNIAKPFDKCKREESCLRVASDLMEDVSSSLYVSSFKSGQLKAMDNDVEEVFKHITMTLEQLLIHNTSHWIDMQSRSDAVGKLKGLKMVSNGVVFNNRILLQERMQEIPVYPVDYVTHSILLLKRNRKLLYSLYSVDPNTPQAIWSQFSLPYSTAASTIYGLNTIVIPYGQMSWPFYETDVPRHLHMARIGFIVAHEVAHHFDTVGMTYHTDTGKGDSVMSADMDPIIDKYQDCWYMKYVQPTTAEKPDGNDVKFQLKPELSLNERIADSGALTLSYEAYTQFAQTSEEQLPWLGMDAKKLYFIGVAQGFCSKDSILDHGVSLFEDEHLPSILRVQDIMENSKAFSDTFHCAEGETKKTVERCEVFPLLNP